MNPFEASCLNIHKLLEIWEPRLLALSEEVVSERKNIQDRSIRQILGHLFDSASNNTHRIVHLQYRENPMSFPNYATFGNNDRWIAIQEYQHEDWNNLFQLWKYANLHLVHVIRNVDPGKLENQWISGESNLISLQGM
ncbi:MAG: DinB family protein, partial [Bacteroidota bacterium]|nr:DinB family protein [Bacteroidota bacterium]